MNTTEKIAIIAGGAFVVIVLFALIMRRRRRRVKPVYFTKQWRALQKHCASRKTWPLAIIDADNLLDEALKKRKYKGKTTGERLVAAQHDLSSNDTVWFGHKLRNQVVDMDVRKLKKQDVINALNGFKQALKDLGALK